jgi:hypothetical protein
MKDPHPYVRDTTAWTIGRVFEFQHDAGNTEVPELITRETLPQVAQVRQPSSCSSDIPFTCRRLAGLARQCAMYVMLTLSFVQQKCAQCIHA